MKVLNITISPANRTGFSNLQKAFDYIIAEKDCCEAFIHLEKGVYEGQFYFDGYRKESGLSPVKLHIKGDGIARTLITGCLCATLPFSTSVDESSFEKRGTFRSYTLFVSGPEVTLENLTVQNTAGLQPPAGCGKEVGQAVALYADAAVMHCRHVSLKGFQDTLFTAPLPLAEHQPNGFKGPREKSERIPSVQVYDHCHIEGTVDFIYGGAGVLFNHCSIFVKKQQESIVCYIAAPSADVPAQIPENALVPEIHQAGYVFYKCRIHGDAIVPVYLGRPWRPYGRCAYIKCHIGRVVSPPGWDNWRDPSNEKKCCFGEYHNTGAGSVSAGNIRAFGSQFERRYVHALVALFKNYK